MLQLSLGTCLRNFILRSPRLAPQGCPGRRCSCFKVGVDVPLYKILVPLLWSPRPASGLSQTGLVKSGTQMAGSWNHSGSYGDRALMSPLFNGFIHIEVQRRQGTCPRPHSPECVTLAVLGQAEGKG